MFEFIPFVFIGVFLHQLKHFAQAWKAKKASEFSFVGYWRDNLPTTIAMLSSAITSYVAVYAAGDMNASAAILAGIGSNTVAGMVGDRNKKVL